MARIEISGYSPGVPSKSFHRLRSKAEFASLSTLVEAWTRLRKSASALGKIGRIPEAKIRGRASLQNPVHDRDAGVHSRREQLEIEALAERIASLAREISNRKQESAVRIEEGSLALHFRTTKERIGEALAVLENQGRATHGRLCGHWFCR